MTGEAWPVLADLPAGPDWDFGGFPYGLEPLTLPPAGSRPPDPSGPGGPDAGLLRRSFDLIGPGAAGGLPPCTAPDELFWFRWITGHQVSFVVWWLAALLVDDAVEARAPWSAIAGPLCSLVRGYGAMLLYTGSCPRGIYHEVIRPGMRRHHPGFSGSWAPDYGPVRDLLRSRWLPFVRSPESGELQRAIGLVRLVHDAVAAKLVPDGRSLLRQSGVRRQDTGLLHLIYDSYFWTLRAAVSRDRVVAQLIRRLVAVARDLAANGLHPSVADADRPPELWAPEVIALETAIPDLLRQVAHDAAGFPAGDPGERAAWARKVDFAGC